MSVAEGTPVVLRDGSTVLIRPVHRGDAPLLAEGFARFSTASRELRFLTGKARLSPAELRYFTEVDHHDHEAIGALDTTGRGLGIARFIRNADDPTVAEVAVSVVDDWQGRGLGAELLSRLTARAREEGIRSFTALVAVDNEAVATLLRSIDGDVRATHREGGVIDYEIATVPEPHRGLRDLLRAFGRGQLTAPGSIREALAALVPERFHQ